MPQDFWFYVIVEPKRLGFCVKKGKNMKDNILTRGQKISLAKKIFFANGGVGSRKGKHCSENHKKKIGIANKVSLKKYYDNGGISPRKGKHHSSETKLKLRKFNLGKCMSEETKNKIKVSSSGEKSHCWKGNEVGYGGLHMWIKKERGNPIVCEECNKKGEKINGKWNIEWANKDHKYRRKKEDWLGLCKLCHIEHDKKLKN